MTKATKTKLLSALAIAGLPVAFILGLWFAGESTDHVARDGRGAERAETAPSDEGATTWTCSMHPQVRMPEPGDCPICGMDLIPVTDLDDPADEADLPRLRVSERSVALMNIQTWPVERRVVEREVRLLGRVNYDERRKRTITAWIPGRLDRFFVHVEGGRVQEGDPVAEIYSPKLISAQEELLQALHTAHARDQENSPMVQAARDRLRLLGLNPRQIQEIEERGTVQDHIVIHSPLEGVITERIAVEGNYVQTGASIAALAALGWVFIDLEAYERDLPWLIEGQTVRFSIEGIAGEEIEGRIDQINPFLDERRRTAQVRVLVENPDGRLKPGMFARGVVESRMGTPDGIKQWRDEPPLVIPATAALITGRRAVVYVKIPEADQPTFELRQVTLGSRAGDRLIVMEGVHEGELVVSHGNFKLDSELQIRGRPSMMAPRVEEDPGEADRIDYRAPPEPAEFAAAVPASFGEELKPVVRGYLDWVSALAADDFEAAREGLVALHEALQKIGQHRLEGEAHVAWMEHYERLHVLTHRIEMAEDLEGMREHLQETTREIEEVIVSFGAGQLPDLYRMYCPMAHDDQGGIWFQDDDAVANPYFGPAMLACGEILGEL